MAQLNQVLNRVEAIFEELSQDGRSPAFADVQEAWTQTRGYDNKRLADIDELLSVIDILIQHLEASNGS